VNLQIHKIAIMLIVFLFPGFALGAANITAAKAATCRDLAEVAYWAGTFHLSSKQDEKELNRSVAYARLKNRERPAISDDLIEDARAQGVFSHGNSGLGNKSMFYARQDALDASLSVYGECIQSASSASGQ